MKKIISLLCLLIVFSNTTPSAWAEEFREFTNKENHKIMARPINIIGGLIRIEREDGTEFNVSKSLFSKSDQAYLDHWAIKKLTEEKRFNIKGNRKNGKVTKESESVTLTTGRVVEDAFHIEKFDGFYKIAIENKTDLTFENIRAEYILFSVEDMKAAKSRHDVIYNRQKGGLKINKIDKRKTFEFETDPIPLRKTKLKKGIIYKGGGSTSTDASLIGIWVRIYANDQVASEYSYPTNLSEEEDW